MKNTIAIFNFVVSGIVGVFAWIYNFKSAFFYVLIAFMIADYLTGSINALLKGTVSSKTGFIGIARKMFIFVMVGVSAMLDKVVPSSQHALEITVCMFYIANEGLSILENAGEIGLPLPKMLKNALAQLNDHASENKDEKG